MNKIWEFMYENQEKIRYRQTEYFSPYYEVSQESIKEMEDQTWQVSFNSFYRYEKVFESLFDLDIKEESRTLLFDCILHYLVCQEFKLGITEEEYNIRQYWAAIEQGVYGDAVQHMFQGLSKEKKHFIARTLYKQSRLCASVYLFARTVTGILDNCVVYRNKIQPTVILVYIQEKNISNQEKILLALEELFLPLNYTMRIFLEKHFGVIEAEQTLEMDQIEIF
ncbi:MAG: hypothetical protein NC412_10895 [Roseburia sp.]|nr:hypothetical protein [Roseburia sp.]MCM1279328.1 hypothetical protein [Robinsoniella sp.]